VTVFLQVLDFAALLAQVMIYTLRTGWRAISRRGIRIACPALADRQLSNLWDDPMSEFA
jgi:hypothetical protein